MLFLLSKKEFITHSHGFKSNLAPFIKNYCHENLVFMNSAGVRFYPSVQPPHTAASLQNYEPNGGGATELMPVTPAFREELLQPLQNTRAVLASNQEHYPNLLFLWTNMRAFLRWMCVVAALAPIQVTLAATTAEQYFAAATQLESLAEKTLLDNRMPRLSEDDVRILFDDVTDSRVLIDVAVARKDVNQMVVVCAKSVELSLRYAMANVKYSVDEIPALLSLDVQLMRRTLKNSVLFQDELSQLQPFMIQCFAVEISLLENFWRELKPEEITYARKQGLRQMVGGIVQTYQGFLGIGAEKDLSEANRERLMKSIADASGVFASTLPLVVRKDFVLNIDRLVSVVPAFAIPYLAKIKAEMLDLNCRGFCEILGD